MSILCDREIRHLCVKSAVWFEYNVSFSPMIEPFSEAVSGNGVISSGLTSAGYDLRLAGEFLIFTTTHGESIDPKRFKEEGYKQKVFVEKKLNPGEKVWIAPHSYVLGMSVEYLRIPRHLKGRCTGKSTLARAGILINTTPLEPGWEGHLTIEIGNVTPCLACVYVDEGICQLEFERLSAEPGVDYKQKGGQYQGQTEVTPPRVK